MKEKIIQKRDQETRGLADELSQARRKIAELESKLAEPDVLNVTDTLEETLHTPIMLGVKFAGNVPKLELDGPI
jgi:hypothetical protein